MRLGQSPMLDSLTGSQTTTIEPMAEVVELRRDEIVMRVDPADGGRFVSLIIAGVERILAKSHARAPAPGLYWGCFAMVPWAGRLSEGRIPTSDSEGRLETQHTTSIVLLIRTSKLAERRLVSAI